MKISKEIEIALDMLDVIASELRDNGDSDTAKDIDGVYLHLNQLRRVCQGIENSVEKMLVQSTAG